MSVQMKVDSYSFEGVSGKIPAHLLTQNQENRKWALLFPGAGYSFREPLLKYGVHALLKKRYQVLVLDKIYADDPSWRSIESETEARKIVQEDTIKVFEQIKMQFSDSPSVLFGRSLGTFAFACLLEKKLIKPKQIVWQTPALGSKWNVMRECNIPGFGILGTADHYYQNAFENLPKERIVVEGADHGMEIPGDPIRSIEILKQVTQATYDWIL